MTSGAPITIRVPAVRRAPKQSRAVAWRVGWAAAAVALAQGAGCSEDRLPPPHARTGAGATTTTTGAGGGAAPDAGVDPGPGPANLCECVAAYGGSDGPCADCFNEQAAVGARCDAKRQGCAGDPACAAISACLKVCGHDPICQRGCVFPDDAGAAHQAFQRVLSCVCAACGATCAYGAPLECVDPDPGSGGAGGGVGGAGGAGGGAPAR